jgi:beta-lactamase regulating signal transducer with metallopeptidase domain
VAAEIFLLLSAAKAALLVGAALVVVCCMPRSAALRHAVLFAAVAGALFLPLLAATLPPLSPLSIPMHPDAAPPELQRWSDHAVRLLLVPSDPASDLASILPPAPHRRRTAVLAVWLAGTALVLLRIGTDLAAARRTRARAVLRAWLARGVPLLESRDIAAPAAAGLFRPAVLIPAGPPVDAAALGSMIAHEQAHIDRRDCLTHLVVRLCCAAYWFDPLVWLAARRIGLERERACDDRVLASGVDPIGYSQLLIDVARRSARRSLRLEAVPSMAQPAHLEKRIACILDRSAARGGLSRPRLVMLAIAAAAIVAPLAALGLHDRAPRQAADPYFDPRSERVPGVRRFDGTEATPDPATADGMLMAILQREAAREPGSRHDLVPDRARWALATARGGRLFEPLLEALHDPDWRVRGYAAWGLGIGGDPGAVEPLLPLLEHPVWRLRAMAAAALRQIGAARAATGMLRALDDPAWQVRLEAVAYFAALRQPRFREHVEPLCNDPHIAVRLAAHEAASAMP